MEGCNKLAAWDKTTVKKIIADYVPAFSSCRKFITIPTIPFAAIMAQKTIAHVFSVDFQDSSTTKGCTEVARHIIPFLPDVSECGNVRKKTVLFGGFAGFEVLAYFHC